MEIDILQYVLAVQLILVYEFHEPCNEEIGNEISRCMYGKTSPQPYSVETELRYQNACTDKLPNKIQFRTLFRKVLHN